MFFGGALQTVAVMLWWLTELVTRYGLTGHYINWSIVPSAAHGYLMIYGLFPFFMFGFLMTTYPRWMNGKEIPAQRYVPAFMLLMLGTVGFDAGLLAGHSVLLVAVVSMLAGWGVALYALLRVLLDAPHPDKLHPKIIFIALSMGWCGLASYFVWLLSGNDAWLHFAIQGGLWLFLLPVFASVGHRMIPFFTSSALPFHHVKRPYWPWWVMLAGSVAHGLLQLADASAWLWLCDAPLAVAACYLSYAWGLAPHTADSVARRAAHRLRLAGYRHAAVSRVQSVVLFISHGTAHIWGLAPLHALTIGCFATLMMGMATRVTLGHSGLPMKVDTPVKLMFAGMQLAAVLRVLADMLPMQARLLAVFFCCCRLAGVLYALGVALPAGLLARACGWAGWLIFINDARCSMACSRRMPWRYSTSH